MKFMKKQPFSVIKQISAFDELIWKWNVKFDCFARSQFQPFRFSGEPMQIESSLANDRDIN